MIEDIIVTISVTILPCNLYLPLWMNIIIRWPSQSLASLFWEVREVTLRTSLAGEEWYVAVEEEWNTIFMCPMQVSESSLPLVSCLLVKATS